MEIWNHVQNITFSPVKSSKQNIAFHEDSKEIKSTRKLVQRPFISPISKQFFYAIKTEQEQAVKIML